MKPTRLLLPITLSLLHACASDPALPPDDPVDREELGEASTELLGEACTPVACSVNQCGLVADGCRSEMWCGDCGCAPGAMSCERPLGRVFELRLRADETYQISTTALSPGADPVMHVVNGYNQEIAFDDDSAGGGNATVSFIADIFNAPTVIVRAKTATSGGTAQLVINGVAQPITFGGTFQTYTNLRAQEQVETIKLFGELADRHVIYALAADGLHLAGRAVGNGTSGGAVWTEPAALAARTFVLGTTAAAASPSHLVRNDASLSGHDADGDGLGSELEAALGTCRTRSETAIGPDGVSFWCGLTQDARDTDGDGLGDGEEVRGLRTVSPHLPLRLWGATPRHKDLFVEIDSSQINSGDPALRLTPAEARRFSDYYGDRVNVLAPATALAHAQTLKNPDGKPGVRAHLDIGVPPESAADAKIYGDWGGYSVVPPAAGGGGQHPNTAFTSYMNAGRIAKFRYALWYPGGGGSTNTSVGCTGCGSYGWASGNDLDTFTHESAHAHGLAHSGPAKDPAVDDPVDPNCKAAYPSIVNYAFTGAGTGFSDGTGVVGVNNAASREHQAVPSLSAKILTTLRDSFGYKVDLATGHVDWNRDGVFAAVGATVRAYTNYQPGNACEFTRYNKGMLPTASNTTVAPAFGRFGAYTFLFSGGTSSLRYVSSTSSFQCPQPSLAACGSWSSTQTLSVDATRGVDAAKVTGGGQSALLVVTTGAAGAVSFVTLRNNSWGLPIWSSAALVPGAVAASGEPSLTTLPDGSALLLYRRSDGLVAQVTYQWTGSSGTWTSRGVAKLETGADLVQAPQAAPGLARANFTGHGQATYGLFARGPEAVLEVRKLDAATWRWLPDLPLDDSNLWWRSVSGRPVGVWVPSADHAQGGRLYLVTTSRDGAGDGTGRGLIMRWSYLQGSSLRIGLTSGYDSWWTYSRGVDLWYEPGIDSNLRAAWSISRLTDPALDTQVRFDPKADGINDYVQADNNDWVQIGYALCRALVNPTGSVTNPIQCGPRPW